MESERSKQNKSPSAHSAMPALPSFLMPEPPQEEKPQGFGARDILTLLFKHKLKIIITFLLAVIATPIVYFQIPKAYEASSLLMIKSGREYMSPNLNNQAVPQWVSLPQVIQTELSILSSKDLGVRVIKAVGLENIYPTFRNKPQTAAVLDIAALFFQKSIKVEAGQNSNILKVSFRHRNPEIAAKIVNQLIDIYKEKRLEILNDNNSAIMIEQKLAEYKGKLDTATDKLELLKQKYQITSFDEQRNLLLKQRMELQTSVMTAQIEVKELRQRVASLESQLKAVPQNVLSSDNTDRANGGELQLLELQRKEQELLGKYKEDAPMVTSLRNEIRLVQEFVEKQKAKSGGRVSTVNDFYRGIQKEILTTQANLSSTEVKVTELSSQLVQADKRLQELDGQENTFRDLQREITTSDQSYQTYLKKREEEHISDEMDRHNMTSINVIEKASKPLIPVSPKKGLLFFVAVAAVLGGGGGLGLSFLLETMKQSLSSPQRAEKRLGLPVLTTVNYQNYRT